MDFAHVLIENQWDYEYSEMILVLLLSFISCCIMTPLELVFSPLFIVLFLVFGFFEITSVLRHESDYIANNILVLTP